MTTAASPADILRAVERWARETKHWAIHGNTAPPGWRVSFASRDECVVSFAPTGHFWTVRPALALAWALLVETDAGPVDVGRCPRCRGAGRWSDCETSEQLRENLGCRDGWHVSDCFADPCLACLGTGVESIPVARLLLDAASGDATAHDRLLVHADYLCERVIHRTNGRDESALGLLLGWALVHWSGEPVDCGLCPTCRGIALWAGTCQTCGNAGRQLGHPHTTEALRWLEWLTWGREFAAERLTTRESLGRAAFMSWSPRIAPDALVLAWNVLQAAWRQHSDLPSGWEFDTMYHQLEPGSVTTVHYRHHTSPMRLVVRVYLEGSRVVGIRDATAHAA